MPTAKPRPRITIGLLSLALAAPAAIPYLVHALPKADGSLPTGYVHPDMAVYMAKGREHFDSGEFTPTYGNPTGPSFDEPRIYMQPLFLAMGAAWRVSGLDPGVVVAITWAVVACLGAWSAVRLYEEVVGLDAWPEKVALVIFFWGGGLLVATGAAWSRLVEHRWPDRVQLFAFDPGDGWWFLSFGRNLIYPTEAFYHFVFFSCARAAVRRRFAAASAWALLMAWSTPFTGAELLLILGAWGFVEVVFLDDGWMPAGFLGAVGAMAAGFAAYYFGFLGRFPGHRKVQAQMTVDWGYQAAIFVPAYLPIGGLAAWTLRTARHAAEALSEPMNRLFLVWAAVAFGLSNHEFAISPRQPIHFDRGYVWTALFFLAAPSLVGLIEWLGRLPRPAGGLLIAGLLAAFLLDNAAWLARFAVYHDRPGVNTDFRLTPAARRILRRVSGPEFIGYTLLIDDEKLGMVAAAQTYLRSWVGHFMETPDYPDRRREVEDLFRRDVFLPAWDGRPLIVVVQSLSGRPFPPRWLAGRGARELDRAGTYVVYEIRPRKAPRPARQGTGDGDGPF